MILGLNKAVSRNLTLVVRVEVQDPRSYAGLPGGNLAPRSCLYVPRNRTKASGSKGSPRAKKCVPGADRSVSRKVTDFVRVGIESLLVTHDFLGLCDSWAAYMFPKSAFEVFTAAKVGG